MAVTRSFCGKAVTWKSTDTARFGSVYAISPTLQGSRYYLKTVIAFSLTRACGLSRELIRSYCSQFGSVEKDCFAAVTASSAASFFTNFQRSNSNFAHRTLICEIPRFAKSHGCPLGFQEDLENTSQHFGFRIN